MVSGLAENYNVNSRRTTLAIGARCPGAEFTYRTSRHSRDDRVLAILEMTVMILPDRSPLGCSQGPLPSALLIPSSNVYIRFTRDTAV